MHVLHGSNEPICGASTPWCMTIKGGKEMLRFEHLGEGPVHMEQIILDLNFNISKSNGFTSMQNYGDKSQK